MKKSILAPLLLLVSISVHADVCQTKSRQEILDGQAALDAFIRQAMAETDTPGVSVAIIADGAILTERAYGTGITQSARFQAGSISKVVSAFASLRTFEIKRIGIELPLNRLVAKPYPDPSPYLGDITLKSVLDHTSGMGNRFGDRAIYFRPGTRFSYSGEAFSYLQQVMEQVTNRPYDSLMDKWFLPSLGMRESVFHFDLGGKPVVLAAASLVSTPSDIARLFIELIRPRPENRSTVALMTSPSIEIIPDRLRWGLGIGIYQCGEEQAFWQWGSNNSAAGAYHSLAIVYQRTKTGIVIMTAGTKGQSLLKNTVKKAIGGPDFGYWDDVPVLY